MKDLIRAGVIIVVFLGASICAFFYNHLHVYFYERHENEPLPKTIHLVCNTKNGKYAAMWDLGYAKNYMKVEPLGVDIYFGYMEYGEVFESSDSTMVKGLVLRYRRQKAEAKQDSVVQTIHYEICK